MKKIILLLLLIISNLLNAQIAESMVGSYQILPSSDSPYNQFNVLQVNNDAITFQVDGIDLFRYEPVETIDPSSIVLKCVLYRGQIPNNEMLNFRYTVNFIQQNEHIRVTITHKNLNQTIDVKRL